MFQCGAASDLDDPFCPAAFLPVVSRTLRVRDGFFNPSLDGGLRLLVLFRPRRSSSAMTSPCERFCSNGQSICSRNAATTSRNVAASPDGEPGPRPEKMGFGRRQRHGKLGRDS